MGWAVSKNTEIKHKNIEIVVTEKGGAVIRPISKKVDDIFCKLHNPGQKAIPQEEIEEAIRNRMKDKYR